jgi:hypothetical protein
MGFDLMLPFFPKFSMVFVEKSAFFIENGKVFAFFSERLFDDASPSGFNQIRYKAKYFFLFEKVCQEAEAIDALF